MYFVYMENGYASEAKTEAEAKQEAAARFIEWLQRWQRGDDSDGYITWLVEEE